MKRKQLRSAAALLAAIMLLSPAGAFASEALGEDLAAKDVLLNEKTMLSTNVFWSTSQSDLRTENLVTYAPSEAVTPMVTYGAALTERMSVAEAARSLEAKGYRVVAGVNGDFYNTSNGLPVGIVISDGILRSTDAGYYAIGFCGDGSVMIGKPAVQISADLGYQMTDSANYATQVVRRIAAVNKVRNNGGIFLYTYDFNDKHTTGTTEDGVNVVCRVIEGEIAVGQTVTAVVERVAQSAFEPIGEGQFVLSVNANADAYFVQGLLGETEGNLVTLTISGGDGWENVREALGALYLLAEDGAVTRGLPADANPRTAIGLRADGTVLLYTIDGRKSGHSIGASLAQVGARLVELGCVSAVCLDGGGSTNLAVTEPSETSATIWNVPSETGRRVSNHLFLVASAEGSGRLDRFYVKTSQDLVLAGSRVTVSARGVDTNHIPMDAAYDLSVSAGTLDGDTLVTPLAGGQITVTARGGGCSGETTVRAVETPERVTVRRNGSAVTSLTLAPASETALTATAEWEHRTLYADAELFTWSLEGDVGRLEDGKFIAETPGSGTLTVTAGGRSTAVPITVTAVPLKTLEDFEEGTLLSSDSVTAERVTSADQVRFGRASMRLDYEMTTGGAFLPIFIQTEAPYRDLNLWVRGDGSGNTLALLTQNGGETEIGTLDFTDWRVFNVRLPETPDTLTGLFIRGEAERGTIYLDQLTASYAGIVDEIAPSVEVQTEGRSVRAQIADATDGILNRSQIAVYCNGRAVEFFSYGTDGALTATFAEEDLPARVSVTARDASGNLARASVDLAAEETERLFTDTETHWAADYADFLYRAGITTGYEDGTFRPDRAVTRAQFAAMLCRYLGLETQEDAALPFADAEEIPAYARGSVAALYERGIVNGSEKNGALSFLPYSNLTRAQAAAMIGRTQEKGYALAEGAFADAASIPAYAELYVRTMVAQGVISGYADGTFRPANNITRGQMAKILYFLM